MAVNADQLAAGIIMAHSCFVQGRYQDAAILLDGLITLQPDNPYLHTMLGSVLHQQNRFDESIASFDRAIELFPENISALTNRGEIHLKQGRLQEAAADLKRASSLDPKKEDPFANRARLLIEMTSALLKAVEEKGMPAVAEAREQQRTPPVDQTPPAPR